MSGFQGGNTYIAPPPSPSVTQWNTNTCCKICLHCTYIWWSLRNRWKSKTCFFVIHYSLIFCFTSKSDHLPPVWVRGGGYLHRPPSPSDTQLNTINFCKRGLMVLILDGDSEIGAHVSSNLCYLICLGHMIMIESWHKSDIFFLRRPSGVRNMLWYHLIYVPWIFATFFLIFRVFVIELKRFEHLENRRLC